MGTWGTKPNENDDYFDLIGAVMATPIAKLDRALQRKITNNSAHYYGNEWRAAALLVRRLADAQLYASDDVLLEHLDLSRAKLTCLRDSVEWMKAWNSPAAMRRVLAAELSEVVILRRAVLRRTERKPRLGGGIVGRVAAITQKRGIAGLAIPNPGSSGDVVRSIESLETVDAKGNKVVKPIVVVRKLRKQKGK